MLRAYYIGPLPLAPDLAVRSAASQCTRVPAKHRQGYCPFWVHLVQLHFKFSIASIQVQLLTMCTVGFASTMFF